MKTFVVIKIYLKIIRSELLFSSFKFIQFISHHLNKKKENEDNFTKNKLIVFQIYYYYIYSEINWN